MEEKEVDDGMQITHQEFAINDKEEWGENWREMWGEEGFCK